MLSCWNDQLFIFCLLLFYLFLPSMGWLRRVGVFGLIECSHSLPALHSGLQIIIIIIITIFPQISYLEALFLHLCDSEIKYFIQAQMTEKYFTALEESGGDIPLHSLTLRNISPHTNGG